MRILVFSDSHGVFLPMRYAIEKHRPDAVIFLGDGERDIRLVMQNSVGISLACVKGNNDLASECPESVALSYGSNRIFATHGHRFRSRESMLFEAVKNDCNILLFGHTHQPVIISDLGITAMNPGSIRDGGCYGIIEGGVCSLHKTH